MNKGKSLGKINQIHSEFHLGSTASLSRHIMSLEVCRNVHEGMFLLPLLPYVNLK